MFIFIPKNLLINVGYPSSFAPDKFLYPIIFELQLFPHNALLGRTARHYPQ